MQVIQKKICMIGMPGVGKTSLVSRYVYQRFQEKYLTTIGTTISRKEVDLGEESTSTRVKLIIWDLSGTEHFSAIMRSYYRGASGAVLVCDLTRPETLGALVHHVREMKAMNPNISFVLVGNKNDLVDERLITDEGLQAISDMHDLPYFLTSAKTGTHVNMAFQTLARALVG